MERTAAGRPSPSAPRSAYPTTESGATFEARPVRTTEELEDLLPTPLLDILPGRRSMEETALRRAVGCLVLYDLNQSDTSASSAYPPAARIGSHRHWLPIHRQPRLAQREPFSASPISLTRRWNTTTRQLAEQHGRDRGNDGGVRALPMVLCMHCGPHTHTREGGCHQSLFRKNLHGHARD